MFPIRGTTGFWAGLHNNDRQCWRILYTHALSASCAVLTDRIQRFALHGFSYSATSLLDTWGQKCTGLLLRQVLLTVLVILFWFLLLSRLPW
jgi:hypothetical protein